MIHLPGKWIEVENGPDIWLTGEEVAIKNLQARVLLLEQHLGLDNPEVVPNRKLVKHTCGKDGDPGATAPLNGFCFACMKETKTGYGKDGDGEQPPTENETMESMEKAHIFKIINRVQGNRKQAAEILGIPERTLYRKLKELGLR